MTKASLRICHRWWLYKLEWLIALSHPTDHSLSLSKLSLLQRMASNDNNGKRKLEEEAESLTARKRLRLSDDDDGGNEGGGGDEGGLLEGIIDEPTRHL
jgi:hypothetical protein